MGRKQDINEQVFNAVKAIQKIEPKIKQRPIAELLRISQPSVSKMQRAESWVSFRKAALNEIDIITQAVENQIPVERLSNRAATTVEKRSFFSRMFKRGEA